MTVLHLWGVTFRSKSGHLLPITIHSRQAKIFFKSVKSTFAGYLRRDEPEITPTLGDYFAPSHQLTQMLVVDGRVKGNPNLTSIASTRDGKRAARSDPLARRGKHLKLNMKKNTKCSQKDHSPIPKS